MCPCSYRVPRLRVLCFSSHFTGRQGKCSERRDGVGKALLLDAAAQIGADSSERSEIPRVNSSEQVGCGLGGQKRSISSGVDHDAETRDVDAGLWLCTDASEPQYTSVIDLHKYKYFFTIFVLKKREDGEAAPPSKKTEGKNTTTHMTDWTGKANPSKKKEGPRGHLL